MSARTVVAIGLGSNLEDPPAQIHRAFDELKELPETKLVGISPLYRSRALLPSSESSPQPDYCNAVALLETVLTPVDLLGRLRAIENAHGRMRKERWASRTLDLDILVYGDLQLKEPQLCIPHPQLQERNFVLYPLRDLAPDMMVPGLGQVDQLASQLSSEGLETWAV